MSSGKGTITPHLLWYPRREIPWGPGDHAPQMAVFNTANSSVKKLLVRKGNEDSQKFSSGSAPVPKSLLLDQKWPYLIRIIRRPSTSKRTLYRLLPNAFMKYRMKVTKIYYGQIPFLLIVSHNNKFWCCWVISELGWFGGCSCTCWKYKKECYVHIPKFKVLELDIEK